mgnify:CR=1 FL=1
MGKGGKYAAPRKKRSGKLLVMIVAILILALAGILHFIKKDDQSKQEVQAPTMQAAIPSPMQDMISVDDVEWAQASIWKDDPVHLFLTTQQIADIIDAINALDADSFEKRPVDSVLTVLLTLSDQEIQLEFDGERVGFQYGEENVSVLDLALLNILTPIERLDNTKQWVSFMTAYDIKNLYLYKDNVTWEYFEDFAYYITGPEEMQIPVEDSHYIYVSGNQDGRPASLLLVENENTENCIDIRTSDINTLLGCFTNTKVDSTLEVKPGSVSETFYNQEQAMLDGCVVIQDFDVLYNQDSWQNFVELTEASAETAVTVVHYTEEESDTTYVRYGVIFDGSVYTLKITSGEQQLTHTFTGLERKSGKYDIWTNGRDRYIYYALTGGMDTPDVVIYNDGITTPPLSEANSFDFHLKEGEPPLAVYEDPTEVEAIVNLLERAEYMEVPPSGYVLGVSLFFEMQNGQKARLEMDILQGVYRYKDSYYRYGEVSDLFQVLGITQWPEEVQQEYNGYLTYS